MNTNKKVPSAGSASCSADAARIRAGELAGENQKPACLAGEMKRAMQATKISLANRRITGFHLAHFCPLADSGRGRADNYCTALVGET